MSSWESYLTPQELNAYTHYFRAASRTQTGIVTGSEAVQFFATSGVPNQILSSIWEAADRDNVGHLTPETFAIALKMIACAQHGYEVAEPALSTSVPLPQFEGLKLDNHQGLANNSPAISSQQQPQQQADGPAMKVTPTEREKYNSIFRVQQPVDGLLDATNAKNIFMKSKLPNETLGQIWNLADVRQAGNLNQTEFAIAMHYIAKLMDGTLSTLPTQLPPSVYATANGDTNNTIVQPSPRPLAATASPHIPHQQQQRSQTIDSLGSMAFSGNDSMTTAPPPTAAYTPWDVTPQEKAQFDTYFDKIDTQRTGFVQGGETVEFFKNSRLPENDLAHIWDLADSGQQGRLTRDQFAVAMHLIHKRLKGDMLPNALPQSLVPPSPHPQAAMAAAAASPAMMAAPLQQQQQSTGLSAPNVQSPAMTGGSVFDDQDLLGDFGNNDRLTQDTNQVNQLQNQISALKTSTGQIQGQKLDTQQTLERLSQQKQELQAQLTQVQMQHETELKELNELQQQLENEKPGFMQATQEHEAAQQQLTTTQNEIAQLQHTLDHGRSESERLRQHVRTIQDETQKLVNDLNALRSQVKQQNMMLDINRRQVTASEQDRDQAKRDLNDFKEERGLPEDVEVPVTTTEEELKSSEVPPATTADTVSSPGASSLASNNNFFDVFSPKSENAETSAPAAAATTSPVPASDFDAIFGSFGGDDSQSSPAVEKKPQQESPLSAFDPVGWATPPESAATPTIGTKSSRPAPPPPPPQSRHHRQTSDQSHVSTPTSATPTTTKKPRAPPPPPPANKSSTSSITSPPPQQQPFSDSTNVFGSDDFDAAFSGQFNETQIVSSTEPTKTDGFDDAFGVDVFDNNKSNNTKKEDEEEEKKKETQEKEKGANDEKPKKASGSDLNWATDFGGFEFNEENKEKKTTNEEDDWDSIFGGSSTTTTNKGVSAEGTTQNTQTITADKDAFVGFEDAFNSSFDSSATPAEKTTTSSTKEKSDTILPSSGNSNLDELIKMGFGQKEAKNALDRYDQDLTKASNFLLDQTTK
ncbi:hypothetical protein BDA99DRAFT_522405 [Phascolomyces articulosus]|uniref:Uncharacterized protein n=1 Tax=Phascolomyces articulosus TaxID=60185 RepID=A0AAD5P9V2_9FUNG|nr:hypothetical protein BDA99DRAFT_522405 [Phascolomyces articulosus]